MGLSQNEKNADVSSRIRDNQRRSRARRKQYVQDLESRLQQLQQQGVQATQEVQAAGRRADEENRRLRSLLQLHGVSQAEIDEYLYPRGEKQSVIPTPHTTLSSPTSLVQQDPRENGIIAKVENQYSVSYPYPSPEDKPSPNEPLRNEPPQDEPLHDEPLQDGLLQIQPQKRSCPPTSNCDGNSSKENQVWNNNIAFEESPSIESSDHQGKKQCCRPEISPSSSSASTSSLPSSQSSTVNESEVTPCEIAARIIASMRDYQDIAEVRQELGCASDDPCTVKNITLFNLLDR